MCSYVALVADPDALDLVAAGPVLHQLAVEIGERPLTERTDAVRRELEPAFALLDEPRVLEHLGQFVQPFERARRVVAEEVARLVDVDLGELTGLGRRLQQVLELVDVAHHLEQPRHLRELHRVVALEVHALVPRAGSGNALLEVARELVDLPAEVEVVEERLRRAPGAARAARASSS